MKLIDDKGNISPYIKVGSYIKPTLEGRIFSITVDRSEIIHFENFPNAKGERGIWMNYAGYLKSMMADPSKDININEEES